MAEELKIGEPITQELIDEIGALRQLANYDSLWIRLQNAGYTEINKMFDILEKPK